MIENKHSVCVICTKFVREIIAFSENLLHKNNGVLCEIR